jgi:hypothetical protein
VAAHSAGAARRVASSSAVAQPAASEEASASKLIFSSFSVGYGGAAVATVHRLFGEPRTAGHLGVGRRPDGTTNTLSLSVALIPANPGAGPVGPYLLYSGFPADSQARIPPSRWDTFE